jgi:tetratricopeptide (TPR) repeat protein
MFKARIRQWGFVKNVSSNDWHALAKLYKSRRDAGKQPTEFLVNGRRKTIADLQKHIRFHNISEEDFLAAADSVTVPPHVRCYTPDPGGSPSPSSCSPELWSLTKSNSSSLHFTPISSHTPLSRRSVSSMEDRPLQQDGSLPNIASVAYIRQPTSQEVVLPQAPGNQDDFVLVSNPSESASETFSSSSCDQVQHDVRTMALQVVNPVALMSRYGAEDIESWVLVNSVEANTGSQESGALCFKCHQPISKHPVGLEAFAPSTRQPRSLLIDTPQDALNLPSTTERHGEAWRWMAFCFAACIYMSRGDQEVADKLLHGAAAEFEDLLLKKDCLTLTSLNLMLAILHTHDQGCIAESILRTTLEEAEHVLPAEDPVRITIEWMTTVAGLKLEKCGHNGEVLVKLGHVHETFETGLGTASPTTIASLYNVAWMLSYEGRWEEAEDKLQALYKSSSTSLGETHMQSTMALTTLSRAQSRQGNYAAAIRSMEQAIRDSASTLGRSHPYRLECKRRLALMWQELGKKEAMEDLYWDVLKGRIKMLGTQHPYTIGAKEDLEGLLRELGRWNDDDSTQWVIDELFTKTSPSSSSHEAY